MARLAIALVGAAIGFAIGGAFGAAAIGAQLGFLGGTLLGGLLFPEQVEGPRLADLRLQRSSYGGMVPIVYGSFRIAGNVIDQPDELTKHEEKSGGKGGGPEVTTETYSVDYVAIALCEGPIVRVKRAWADGRLVYDIDQGSSDDPTTDENFPFTLYTGTETQDPDPSLEAANGVGNVPAYRGTAYVMKTDWLLTDFGNRIPSMEWEVEAVGDVNGPITTVKVNLFESELTGYDATGQWPLTAGEVRTGLRDNTHTGTVHLNPLSASTFDAETLTGPTSTDDPTDVDAWPQQINAGVDGHEVRFTAHGLYYGAGDELRGVWFHDTELTPVWATNDLNLTSGYPVSGTDLLSIWNIPAPHEVVAVVTSADHRILFLFTRDGTSGTPAPNADHWWKLIADVIVDDGTIIPSLIALGQIGVDHLVAARTGVGQGRGNAACAENNGQYIWNWQSGMNASGHAGGTLRVLSFEADGNMIVDPVAGAYQIDQVVHDAEPPAEISFEQHWGSIIAIGTGYCGIVCGNMMGVYRRTTPGGKITLGEIVADVSRRAGFDDSEIDVTDLPDPVDGYGITSRGQARGMIEPLQAAWFFDPCEVDGTVRFVKRGKPALLTIPDDDLAAHDEGEELPDLITVVRTQEVELPRETTVNYLQVDADYQIGTQRAERQSSQYSEQQNTMSLPIVMSDQKARSVAHVNEFGPWIEREKLAISVAREYLKLIPTSVIRAGGYELRIERMTYTPSGVIKIAGVPSTSTVYAQPGVGAIGSGGTPGQELKIKQPTDVLLLDIPLVVDGDKQYGFYAAMAPASDGSWSGAALLKSVDGGANYTEIAATNIAATMGLTVDALGDFDGGNTVDEGNTVDVVLSHGELSGTTLLGLLNGANVALIGDELVGFRDATLIDTDTYTLTGLLRGRRGTESGMATHAADERFVLMPVLDVDSPLSEVGQERLYKAVTFGKTLDSATAVPFTNTGARLRPYSVVELGGGPDSSGDVTLHWTRRTRIGGEWVDVVDVPLSEETETYIVEIWDSTYTDCARSFDSPTPYTLILSSDQVTDFGAEQAHIYFTVAQLGTVGIGVRARGVAIGVGSTDDAVLSPITPYGE